jgi:hypothetical protein
LLRLACREWATRNEQRTGAAADTVNRFEPKGVDADDAPRMTALCGARDAIAEKIIAAPDLTSMHVAIKSRCDGNLPARRGHGD